MKLYIGLLSGTSADAIDAVLVDLQETKPEIKATYTLRIPKDIKQLVFDLAISGDDEIEKMRVLDISYGKMFSVAALKVCEEAGIKPKDILAIGSHGQTIRHYPPSASTYDNSNNQGYSLQIGDPNIIAESTNITTIADFRRRDIAAGGHGAPLAPALHNNLFKSDKQNRIIINTGGIANITYLTPSGSAIGFDTGPANGLMDHWSRLHNGKSFDEGGEWALSGTCNNQLLNQLLKHPYFGLTIPKSTGREVFNLNWLLKELSDFAKPIDTADVQATLLALTVESIADAIESIDTNKSEVYICGGGAHNTALCNALAERLAPRYFSSTDTLGIPVDWVEAVAFAWLAKQTMERTSGNLPSVTGAKKEVILGGIYWGA
jgi:anhydro-N-acetylmuramic acid kinase